MNPTSILEIQRQNTSREYALTGGPVTIGRADDNTVVLEDVVASRYHARIEWIESLPHLIDLGSANGTTVNGETITPNLPYPIKSGDIIQITDYQLTLHEPEKGRMEGMEVSSRSHSGDKPAVLTRAEPATVTL